MRYQSFLFRTVERELFQTKVNVGLRKQRKVYHGILQTLEMSRKKTLVFAISDRNRISL